MQSFLPRATGEIVQFVEQLQICPGCAGSPPSCPGCRHPTGRLSILALFPNRQTFHPCTQEVFNFSFFSCEAASSIKSSVRLFCCTVHSRNFGVSEVRQCLGEK